LSEELAFYWELGADIVERQKTARWGSGFLKQLSTDLMTEFPDMKGFSHNNLQYIKRWYLFYTKGIVKCGTGCSIFVQQPAAQMPQSVSTQKVPQTMAPMDETQKVQRIVAQLVQIPWSHNLVIISKCKDVTEALYYVNQTNEHNWSRNVLIHQIECGLYRREGKAVTNFAATLPAPQSDLAQQLIKDPYNFDFLTLTKDYNERVLENALIDHITKFLLELGVDFAYVGRQKSLQVGERDFFLDLLFCHTKLHCYVIIELKTGEFEPEYAGKLNFYLKAMEDWDASVEEDLLAAHELLMRGLVDETGRYRSGGVGIFRGEQLVHMAPPAERVPKLMADLLDWLENTNEHPLVASCIFHYEFEFIHPFADGNGRMGRLWQTLILWNWKPLLAYLPVETVIRDRQEDYCRVLAVADQQADATPFVELMLGALCDAVREAVLTDHVSDQVTDQVAVLIRMINTGELGSKDLVQALGLSHRPTFRNNYLNPAMEDEWIKRTQPDSPRSPTQRYRLTSKGWRWLQSHAEE
jgi:predicted nuclease of restriction endonuclease-like (RecB) superfamily/fido (protein-threonine AMPylation protein)